MKRIATLLLLSCLACGPAEDPKATSTAPLNVVVITLDTCRADALGVYGQPLPTSPRIDALAADGLLFEHAVSSAPSTFPSHSSLFTGKEPYAHGARSNLGYELAEGNVTLAEVLNSRGYVTGAQIAAPVLARGRKLEQGFDSYVDPGKTETVLEKLDAAEKGRFRLTRDAEEITEQGLAFLRANSQRPFLLWLHYFDIHRPYDPPPEFLQRIPGSPYHAEVARVDDAVGRIADEIERLGIRKHTLVVVTADHGEGLGEHGEESHSFFVYDSTVRVPLVLWGADVVPRGARADTVVRLVDVAPTVLDLVGAPTPPGIQGVSLRPLLGEPERDLSLLGYGESIEPATTFGASPLRFVRYGRWKYIHKLIPELYDVETDPSELNDLAASQPEVVAEMRARLRSLLAAAPKAPTGAQVDMDPATLQQLHALGYVGGPSMAEPEDELAEFEPHGPDPTTRIDDVWQMSTAMGMILNGRFTEAETILRPIAERNPNSISPIHYLITAIQKQNRIDDTIPLYRRLIELEPESAAPKSDLAKILRSKGENQEAEDLFRQALLIDECTIPARLHLSDLLHSEGRYADQVAVLEAGTECFDSQITRNALAYALATAPVDDVRDGHRALEIANRVVEETKRRHPDYLDTQACAYAELGQFEPAIAAVDQALALLEGHDIPEAMEAYRDHRASFLAGEPVRDP